MKKIGRREFLEAVTWGAAAIAARPGAAFQKSGERSPNIVFILTDDLGYGDPGCNNPASKIPMPNVSRYDPEFIFSCPPSGNCMEVRCVDLPS